MTKFYREETAHSRILRCLTQLGHERFRDPLLPRNAWRVEEDDIGFSCKTEGQTFLGISSIAACIAMFLRTTDL